MRVQPREGAGVTVRGLTSAPGWKADGAASPRGARAVEGDAQSRDVPSQPRERQHRAAAVSPPPCAHQGRDGCWVKSHGQAWGQRGLQFVSW